jgi:secretion/DNA translocation related TadE-like protein
MVAVVAVVLMSTVGALAVGSAVVAAHRARAAADLAALAGATGLARGQDGAGACATAASVARRNGAALTACGAAADGSVVLRTRTAVAFGLPGLPRSARSTSRAGPAG